jgi:two-component system, sensor histidine kinase and response regulator
MGDHFDIGNITDTQNGILGQPQIGTFAEASQGSSGTLDIDGLLNRVEQDRGIAREIADVFLQDVPNQLAAIEHAMQTEDVDALRRAAHALKGASACAGANCVREHALQLETAAHGANLDYVAGVLASLKSQIAAYRVLLEQVLPKSQSPENLRSGQL